MFNAYFRRLVPQDGVDATKESSVICICPDQTVFMKNNHTERL